MKRFKMVSAFTCLMACGTFPVARADDTKPVDLLRLPIVKWERTPVFDVEPANLKALTDGNVTTVATIKAAAGSVEILLGFSETLVTPERMEVRLPERASPGSGTARVEILVSTVSSKAGFQSLRTDPLKSTAGPQVFSFPPTAAKWILVRFTAKEKAEHVAVAELAIFGREGPPVSRYAFKETPARAFDVLARLEKTSSIKVGITDAEAALFADVKDGRFQKWSFAEAALIASGIADPEKRKGYLKRLDTLEAQARSAVAEGKTPFEKGEKLLAWMHAKDGPLSKGYSSKQTDLSVVLDTGTFNCVSSAVLYNVLGRRLGLDVRAIEVPDHAFSILYDGTRHADVETTTASGFDPARDKAAQEKIEKQTGFRYIPERNRDQRREIGEAGLVAIIYYNHGVALTGSKQHYDALLAYFRAMALDREFASAVKNALTSLANWSGGLAEEGKYEFARDVLAVGLDLAPKDATFLHNRKVVWNQWAEAASKAGKPEEAIDILRRAAVEVPDGNFLALQAWVYIRRGEDFIKAGEWEKALAAVEPGVEKVDATPRKELLTWIAGVPLRQSQVAMDAKDYKKAIDLLDAARVRQPKDERLTQNIVYAVQEWVRGTYAREGEVKASEILSEQLKRFPQMTKLNDVATGHTQRVVEALRKAGKYEECLAVVERHEKFLKEKDAARNLNRSIIDTWANSLSKEKKWPDAIDVYERGMKKFPRDEHLKSNFLYTLQEWTKEIHSSGGTEKAKATLLEMQKRFPDMKEIDKLAKAHVQRIVSELRNDAKFAEALAAIADSKDLLKGKDDAKSLAHSVYDTWANGLVQNQEWQKAVDVYAKGLEQYPKDGHLINNAVAVWNQWATTFIDKKEWNEAIKIYEKAMVQFPQNGTLKNNLQYCKKQLMK